MSKTTCPHCGAEEQRDQPSDENIVWWKCGNSDYWIKRVGVYPDKCRIRALEARYTKLQSAWVGLTTELHLRDSVGFEEGDVSAVISRWEDEAHE